MNSMVDSLFDQYDRGRLPRRHLVQALAAPEAETDRDFVLGMVRTSIRLHKPQRMLILGHNDCGAYPGAEPEVVAADVVKAAEIVRAAGLGLRVECYFCDFDGVYRVD